MSCIATVALSLCPPVIQQQQQHPYELLSYHSCVATLAAAHSYAGTTQGGAGCAWPSAPGPQAWNPRQRSRAANGAPTFKRQRSVPQGTPAHPALTGTVLAGGTIKAGDVSRCGVCVYCFILHLPLFFLPSSAPEYFFMGVVNNVLGKFRKNLKTSLFKNITWILYPLSWS